MKHLSSVFLGIALIAIPAQAAFTDISTCNNAVPAPAGSLINTPGDYQITADLTASSNCILITASNVSLKLNGHIITGANSGTGILVFAAGRLDHVGIEGPGLIKGFATGIALLNTDYSQVNRVTAAANGGIGILANGSTFLTLGYNVTTQNGFFGIELQTCTNSAVAFNEMNGNGIAVSSAIKAGLFVFSASNNNQVNNNQASGNGVAGGTFNSGLLILSNGNRVYNNSTDGNLGAGIQATAGAANNQIFSNLSSVGNGGFDLQDDNTNCGTNVWTDNVAFTKNPSSCVK
jgi:hypothetical protein